MTLMAKRKLTADQARAVQDQGCGRSRYGSGAGDPRARDFEKPEALNINPKDLALLDLAEYDARQQGALGFQAFEPGHDGFARLSERRGLREFWWWSGYTRWGGSLTR